MTAVGPEDYLRVSQDNNWAEADGTEREFCFRSILFESDMSAANAS